MRTEKQQLLIEYLISSPDVFALTTSIIQPRYFDPEFISTLKFITSYYNAYNAIPNPIQISAETDAIYNLHLVTKDQIEYCAKEIEKFCQRRAMEFAFMEGADLISKGEYNEAHNLMADALTVSINSSVGLSLFEDPAAMLARVAEHRPIPTNYKILDEYLGGGAYRQQMILLSANSGVGKSVVMANFGLNFVEQGLKVLLITLELSIDLIYTRYASMISNIGSRELLDRANEAVISIQDLEQTVGTGDLFIEQMASGSTNAIKIRAFLKEFELKRGFTPDVLILDYLELMAPNERVSSEQVHEKDKCIAEQFRQILVDYNMIGITASQQNRGAIGSTDINHSHIAGGISKINTTDVSGSLVRSPKFVGLGVIGIYLMKTRVSDGTGKMALLSWDPVSLRITDRLHSTDDQLHIEEYSSTSAKIQKPAFTPAANKKVDTPKSQLSAMFSFDNCDLGD